MAEGEAVRYVPIKEARAMRGLRIAFTSGVPGAWGVAIKMILDLKGIDYIPVAQIPGAPNEELKAWTGQSSAPVLMLNDDRPRTQWSEMLVLAEQLQPEPRMIPVDEDERMALFGFCHEICGDDGLGWNVRLMLLSGEHGSGEEDDGTLLMRSRYSSPVDNNYSRNRVRQIVGAMVKRLESQAAKGSRYFMGDGLTAADIYWTAFSNLFAAMSSDLCTMPDYVRGFGKLLEVYMGEPTPQILLNHRDYIARTHFRLPITL
ncbi:hypothetical protein [Sphingobium tyrosinilyticum]|uniref:Glutathione S-transferase n=1 Tax=Sphingobium tyrosinilyticum TaxID=2715436 RepID=A0ABV9EYI8_9SPHN